MPPSLRRVLRYAAGGQHYPASPVDGTIELLSPAALLSAAISGEIKAIKATARLLPRCQKSASHLPSLPSPTCPPLLNPPSLSVMDVLAGKTTYETLNNNNVVISHSLFRRVSI